MSLPFLDKHFSPFRFRDTANTFDASSKRYVITNPPSDFNLLPTDQVGFFSPSTYYSLLAL
jgi:hypothetical protein